MSIGFTFPFSTATGSLGYFQMTNSELAAVKENLKSLLLTNWGERVMNYSFGCNLIEFLFENEGTAELKNHIVDRIDQQVSTWMPFVSIDEIDILLPTENPDVPEHAMRVKIRFRLNSRPDLADTLDQLVVNGSD